MRQAVIVAGVRTPVGRGIKGTLRDVRPESLGALAVKEVLSRAGQVDPSEIEDVILGCSFPEGEQGMNIARIVAMKAGLPVSVPGVTVNRFCSSGLQAIAMGAQQILSGSAEAVIAGGVESMSTIPIGGRTNAPDPNLIERNPDVYISMGHTAENVAKRYKITREEQDAFAANSHQKAAEAYRQGLFQEETIPVKFTQRSFRNGKAYSEEVIFDIDELVRPDTTLEGLAKLRPSFQIDGSVTAGNSSPIADGAAAVLLMSDKRAAELGLRPLAAFRSFAVCGVEPSIMGIGPVAAVPKALKQAGLTLTDIDTVELNEAFAVQSLACIRELGLDEAKVNPGGGAIALGHPLGCTGAKLTVSLIHHLQRVGGRYGLVTMCIGGGMGAAGIFEIL